MIAWEVAADRQRECTQLGVRYSSKAVKKSDVEALKGVSRPMLHTVEEALASIFKVYWTNRNTTMKADGLLTFFGLFFKRAGKKLTKILESLKEDDECNAFLIAIAVCEWSMRKELQDRLDQMLSIGFPALPEPVLPEPSQQQPKPKSK